MSAKVHMDEETPHMHLIFFLLFIQLKKENNILLDAEKHIQKEDRQKEWEMEL